MRCDEKVFCGLPLSFAKKRAFPLSKMLSFAKEKDVRPIILDTSSVARALHKFYEMAGFHRICTQELPIRYLYPDRDSLLYMLDL